MHDRPRAQLQTCRDLQYRYEEHKGDDAAAANTDEPNILAVRLLWYNTQPLCRDLWSALLVLWQALQPSLACCADYCCTCYNDVTFRMLQTASQILHCHIAISG